jgi:NO-binding membrane sensor protein with MHYT domain
VPIVHVHNFSYGLLNPALGYIMSCLGAFLGLRCVARARAYGGVARALWLLLASVSLGATGIWVMHFIAMLGFTIPGQTILYNVPITMVSMLVAVAVVAVGLFIVGYSRREGPIPLLAGGVIIGVGVASMHYIGMDAMRMPDMMQYNPGLVAVSVVIAVVAGTAALWAGLRVRGAWQTLGASLIMGAAVTGMHYTGMAAMHVVSPSSAGVYAASSGSGGDTAQSFVLPLVLGIAISTFLVTVLIMLAPSEDEIAADAQLASRLSDRGGPARHRR